MLQYQDVRGIPSLFPSQNLRTGSFIPPRTFSRPPWSGCRPGLISRKLAPSFAKAVYIDLYSSILPQAKVLTPDSLSNIHFTRIFCSGSLHFSNNECVDMVVAGQAEHWYNYSWNIKMMQYDEKSSDLPSPIALVSSQSEVNKSFAVCNSRTPLCCDLSQSSGWTACLSDAYEDISWVDLHVP